MTEATTCVLYFDCVPVEIIAIMDVQTSGNETTMLIWLFEYELLEPVSCFNSTEVENGVFETSVKSFIVER